MAQPVTVDLNDRLRDIQKRWLAATRGEKDRIYAQEFGPLFAPEFANLPLHEAPLGQARPRALVSVLGLSWQPAALLAAWAQPERMLLIGTDESFAVRVGEESAVELIVRIGGLDRARLDLRIVPDHAEVEIYQAVREFCGLYGNRQGEVFIDPTGGKKSMSSAAALAGFLVGAKLIYVDYLQYQDRIPVAGTEYPRLLRNPLEVLGDLDWQRIADAFNSGRYADAEERARDLAARLYEPREAELWEMLARGYGHWEDFDFAQAFATLDEAARHLERFCEFGDVQWCQDLYHRVTRQLRVLDQLRELTQPKSTRADERISVQDGLPLVLNHLAASLRARRLGRVEEAIQLLYATVERYVDLCLWAEFGLDDEHPDYELIACNLDPDRYHELGMRFHGQNYQPREPCGPIMFSNGVQLLATLRPDLMPDDRATLGPLRGLSQHRNKTRYEHGLIPRPTKPEHFDDYVSAVRQVVARPLGSEQVLEEALNDYEFPTFER